MNAANISILQSTVDSQQTEIDTLQSVVGNIQSSQWATNPDGSIGFNGNVWVNSLNAQSAVSIGNFKFSNGGVQPAPPIVKDTISTPNKLAVLAGKEISLLSDTVKIGDYNSTVRFDVNGSVRVRDYLWVEDGIIVGRRYEGEKAKVDTVAAKKVEAENVKADTIKSELVKAVTVKAEETVRVGNGNMINIDGINGKITSTTGVIDFGNTNLKTTGAIYTNTLSADNLNVNYTSFDSLHVQNRIKIGNSIFIDATPLTTNNIYTDNTTPTELLIQSKSGFNHNTIINFDNYGKVGIGTNDPHEKLEVSGTGRFGYNDIINNIYGYVDIGFNTAHSIINSSHDLLINYYSGKNVYIATNTSQNGPGVGNLLVGGKMGIGTDNPQKKLHVYSTNYCETALRLEFHYIPPPTPDGCASSSVWDISANGGNILNFTTPSLSTPVLTLTGEGNVGIGTTNPSALFHAFQNQPDQIGIYVGDPASKRIYIVPNIQTPANFNPIAQSNDIGIFFKGPPNDKNGLVIAPEYSIEGGIRINPQGLTTISVKVDTNFALTVKNLTPLNGAGKGKGLLIKVGGEGTGIEVRNANEVPIFMVDMKSQKTFMRGFESTIYGFPDYVFEDGYNLMPLMEKKKYWEENKRLPGFSPASEIAQKVDIPELIAKQMKEIEELYLYLIEIKKENEMLKQRIELLEQKNSK